MTEIRFLGRLGGTIGDGTTAGVDWDLSEEEIVKGGVVVATGLRATARLSVMQLAALDRLGLGEWHWIRAEVMGDNPYKADVLQRRREPGTATKVVLWVLPRDDAPPASVSLADFVVG